MNGKKPSWLLRAGSFLLAALMVFGNLYLPSGILAVSAEETENILFSTDFENYTVGKSPNATDTTWRIFKAGTWINDFTSDSANATASIDDVTIAEVNGNKLLRISNDAGTKISANYTFGGAQSDVTISYYVAVIKMGEMVFPSPAAYASEGNEQVFMGTNNSLNMRYKSSSDWVDVTNKEDSSAVQIRAAQWHQVVMHYTTSGCTVTIDGKETGVTATGTSAVKVLSMVANSARSGEMYIDNIKVTSGDQTPLAEPTTALTADTVVFAEDYEGVALSTSESVAMPDGWYVSSKNVDTGYSVASDPDTNFPDNQVLKIAVANNSISNRSRVGYAPALTQAVLEYRFYPTDDTLYLPSLSGENENNVTKTKVVNLIYFPGNGQLVYRDAAGTDHTLVAAADLAKNKWHTLKLAVDAEANKFYFYCDGKYAGSGDLLSSISMNGIYQNCLRTGSTGDQATYFDDFKIMAYVSAEEFNVSQSELALNVNETQTISWNFTASDGAIEGVTIDDVVVTNIDATVATMDDDGKITALKAGTTTITLDPVQEGLESKTVTVTVENEAVEPESYYTQNFESVTLTDGIGESPLGFGDTSSGTNKGVGFRVKEVTGKDGQTTKALEVYYTNDALYKTETVDGAEKKYYDTYSQLMNVQAADAQVEKAVLEYDLYYSDGAATMYPLTLRSGYGFGVQLVLEGSGKLRTNTGSETIKQLTKNEWHHIKIVGDAATDKWYIWVDGEHIPVVNNGTNGNVSGFRGVYMTTYHNNDTVKPENIFFDNIEYYEYIPADTMSVDKTSLELDVNDNSTAQLTVTFGGESASLPVATFTSNDTDVVTVDANGLVTAVKSGTTTITVTAAGESSLTQTVTVTVSGTAEPKVYYSENFDDETVGENVLALDPVFHSDDTSATNAAYYTVQNTAVGSSTTNYLRVDENVTSGNIRVGVRPWTDYTLAKAVLEYKLYFPNGTESTFPLQFFSSQQNEKLAMLVLEAGGLLKYQPNGSTTNIPLATLSADTWHDIKLVMDVTNSRWYLYINDEFVANISGFKGNITTAPYIRGLALDTWSGHNATGICYDDIIVSEYIPVTGMTVAETTVGMKTGETYKLNVSFTGDNASAPAATYAVSNSSVISVDANGNITALAAGTATITVTHPDLPDVSYTVNVTVEKKIVTDPIIYYEEDFNDVEITDGIGAVPSPMTTDALGFRVKEFTDAENNVQKALEIYYEEAISSGRYEAYVTLDKSYPAMVLEYKLYYTDGAATMFAPSLRGNSGSNSYAQSIVLEGGGKLRTDVGQETIVQLEKDTWHDIKIVGDVNTMKWYIWVDGVYYPLVNNSLTSGTTALNGLRMQTYHNEGNAVPSNIYFDDIKLYQPITTTGMTVTNDAGDAITSETVLDLKANEGEEYNLNVSFSPANGSSNAPVFSTSDATVADVDIYGTIYAKGEGTAMITVASALGDVDPVKITVKVTGTYAPKPILDETFQDETEGTTGGAVISGSETAYGYVFEKNNGNLLFQVNSNDSNAHGFASFPFLNAKGSRVSYSDTVYASYWMAVSDLTGTFYIPMLASNTAGGQCAVIATKPDGTFEYSTDGNSWTDVTYADGTAVTFKANEWVLVEIAFNKGNLTMWINEQSVKFDYNGQDAVNAFTMQMSKWMGTQVAYIDNIKITVNEHEPYDAPDWNLIVPTEGVYFVDEDGTPITDLTVNAKVPTTLNVAFNPLGATDRAVSFVSSDTDVADFNSNGKLVGYKSGSTKITATLDGNNSITAQLNVTIHVIDVTDITITNVELDAVPGEEDTYTLVVGDHGFATAQITPANASFNTIVWSSLSPNVATVDSYGEIVARSAGTAVIKATSEDGTKSDTITIVVTEPGVDETYYVSDVNSLKNALASVAEINANGGMTGNIVIEMADGYYYLTETLKLGIEHSGTNGYSVIIKAAENAQPIISGASVITGEWTEVEGKGYYSIQVGKNVDSRQLYINNIRATRAREEGGLTDVKELFDDQTRSIGFTSADVDLLDIAENRREDLEIVFKEQWTQPRIGITSITDNGDGTVNLILDQPGWSGIGGSQDNSVSNKGGTSATAKAIVWIENALEYLDEPGEWYLDTHASEDYNILYYMPRAWEDLDNAYVTMPTLDNSIASEDGDGALVEISGTFNPDKDGNTNYNDVAEQVQNIHFEGITFADTTWMRPSSKQGVSDAQNNHIRESGDTLAPGAVLVQAANCIWFTDCTFTRLGINGLQMINGVQNSFIIGNHFYDISGNAINIGEPSVDAANAYAQGVNTMKNNDILNNFIHNIGVDYGSSAAISVGFAADMDMNHNEIFDIPYSGWHIGYGWNTRFSNNNKNMLLEYNFVHDFMDHGIYDGSAFYTLGNMSGEGYNGGYSFIRRNYIRNQMNAHGALYPDQGTTYLKLVENVIDLSESEAWVSGAPKWSHTNEVCMHIHYIDNYSTTDYKTYSNKLDFEADDIQYGDLHISEDASWTDSVALDVIENAGLEEAYGSLRNGQVERFEIAVDGETYDGSEMNLEIGGNIQLSYTASAIREGEIVTSGLNYQQYYQSQDTSVITVDENGKITAVGRGIAKVYVWVVSNNVVDMESITVVVADAADHIQLDGVDNVISMSTESDWQLTAMVISELGRELTPDSVTYAIADKSVATVDANGLVQPVAVGETTLTVTAVYNGVTVSDIFKVEITEPSAIKTINAAELFDADLEHLWVMSGATNWELVDDTYVTGKFSSYATFGGAEYGNELLSFKLKIDGSGSWPSIVLRAQGLAGEVNSGAADGYIFCMGPDGIQAYRFVDGVRYVIRGDQEDNGSTVIRLPGAEGVVSPEESGFVFTKNVAEYDIRVGAVNDGGNVRILLYVGDKLVIDFVDKIANGAIDEPGYFGVIGRGQTFTLTKNTEIADEEDTESVAPAAQIGGTTYASVDAAMADAQSGDTVVLLDHQKADSLFVRDGIALDLNGYELEVDYLIAFGSELIMDSAPGVGLIKCTNISMNKDNKYMPVWDETAGGYRLFSAVDYQKYRWQQDDSFQFIAKPALNIAANDIFVAQAAQNDRLKIKMRLSWTNGSGNDVEQSFTMKQDDLYTVYTVDEFLIQLTVTGTANYKGQISTTTVIESDTGVVWAADPRSYTGAQN